MPSANTALFFLGLLVLGLLLEPLADRARVPRSVVLVPLGFLASEIATRVFAVELGIRWHNLGVFISHFIVPSLVFESALRLDMEMLRRNAFAVSMLAFPLMLVAAAMVAVISYTGIDHPQGFPWVVALLAGAILSSTEMTGMFSLLIRSGAAERTVWTLEGESIFNDTASVLLFSLILSLALQDSSAIGAPDVAMDFCRLFFGGLAVGGAGGFLLRLVWRRLPGTNSFGVLSIVCAYGVFVLAQDVLQVSGALAVLVAGLVLCSRLPHHGDEHEFPAALWTFMAQFAGSLVFLLAGVSITPAMFADQWLAMIIGAAAVLLSRSGVVFLILGPASHLPGVERITLRDQVMLTWGSVRGSMTMALALSLPLALPSWYTLQSLVYGAVLFSLFAQATTVSRLGGCLYGECNRR
ncbi:MAG: cation:proton antiporter [Gammaproteobacteria bacterium]|nr:cation:proton antiporter [Gammaproteobacteria bacterium]